MEEFQKHFNSSYAYALYQRKDKKNPDYEWINEWTPRYQELTKQMTDEQKDEMHLHSPDDLLRRDKCLYLIHNQQLVGCIAGYLRKQVVEIESVGIHPDYRNKKLCTKILSFFISLWPSIYRFELDNMGGIGACRCYINAFHSMGYDHSLHYQINYIYPEEYNFKPAEEKCTALGTGYTMVFTKRKGGRTRKRSTRKRYA